MLHNDGYPNAVASSTLDTTGSGYVTTYTLYDSLLRQRQTQRPAPGGGRILTDTLYDSRGLAYLTNAPYFSAASPGVLLGGLTTVPSSTLTTYDNAGRPAAAIFRIDGTEQWRTSTSYGGDHVDVTTPTGGTATSTYADARGQTTSLRQYHGSVPTGAYDTTTYTHTRAGDPASIVDSAGNTWSYGYDQRRRRITSDEPDKGHGSYTYDSADHLLTATDARGVTLTYAYDTLGRRTGEYNGGIAPANQLAGWTYDTLARGLLTASTRYVGGAAGSAYVNAVTGYDVLSRPTGTSVTVPGVEGQLAGTYTSASTYNVDGTPATRTIPSAGSGAGMLPAETLSFGYTALGRPATLSGQTSYVTATDYDSLGNRIGLDLSDGSGRRSTRSGATSTAPTGSPNAACRTPTSAPCARAPTPATTTPAPSPPRGTSPTSTAPARTTTSATATTTCAASSTPGHPAAATARSTPRPRDWPGRRRTGRASATTSPATGSPAPTTPAPATPCARPATRHRCRRPRTS